MVLSGFPCKGLFECEPSLSISPSYSCSKFRILPIFCEIRYNGGEAKKGLLQL